MMSVEGASASSPIMLMEAQASIRVDTSLGAFALTWANVRPAGGGLHHKSVCAAFVPTPMKKPPDGAGGLS
jgi:hypothetical protein